MKGDLLAPGYRCRNVRHHRRAEVLLLAGPIFTAGVDSQRCSDYKPVPVWMTESISAASSGQAAELRAELCPPQCCQQRFSHGDCGLLADEQTRVQKVASPSGEDRPLL